METDPFILTLRKMDQKWPVVLFGPAGPGYTLKTKGEPVVLHMGGKVYPERLLKASAKRWVGRPVFNEHHYPQAGKSDHRLRKGGTFGAIGAVVEAWWMPATSEIRGIIRATSRPWQRTLETALSDGNLAEIGLSQMVSVFTAGELKVGRERLPIVSEIAEIFSLDLTQAPLSGGRFLDGPRNPEWLLEAALYRLACYR
jgi:hypothetical protein